MPQTRIWAALLCCEVSSAPLSVRRDHQLQRIVIWFLSVFVATLPLVLSSQNWAEITDFFCQISLPSKLEEFTHSSFFKAKIPEETVVLEQMETSAVVSAEALENLKVELIIDKSKTHFNTTLKSKHRGVVGE